MQAGADPVGKEDNEQDEQSGDTGVDQEGGGGDGRFFGVFIAAADIADMGIFQQPDLGLFEDRRDYQE